MLETLTISNYALIDQVNLEFTPGLNIITGETGAGKSIMLGALSLLLGGRAESKAIADKSRKTVVEAVFSNPDAELAPAFEENGLEWHPGEILVRREISPTGRSRAFINDTPVTLPVLSSISGTLLDIHSQNSNIELSQGSRHLAILDAMGEGASMLADYRSDFGKYVTLRAKIRKIKEQTERNKANRDFIAFQLEQLDKVNPKEGELRQVEQDFDLLSDADQLRENLSEAYGALDGGDASSLPRLDTAIGWLDKVNLSLFESNEEENGLMHRLDNVRIELKDITETVRDYLDQVGSDPGKLARVTARMTQLYDAMKRFKVTDENELIRLHRELKEKLNAIDFGDDNIQGLEAEARTLARGLKAKADSLTELRRRSGELLAQQLAEVAKPLGLPNLRFEVELTTGKLTAEGQDTVEFLCSFNKNHPLQPMSKVASGGETARMMLSLKSILARRMNLPTVIFDEVDTGVSGDIADRIGMMMRGMGKEMQVLAITHLPQVASKGDAHFKVYKEDGGERTTSHVRRLSDNERIDEIAGMLSGTEVNEAALANARVLLGM